jgi:two-component system nitrate/nitrite response regulator NarL
MTPRQSEVAELVAFGLSNKQIARALGISPATVKCHVHEILTKLGVPRRSGVGWALA